MAEAQPVPQPPELPTGHRQVGVTHCIVSSLKGSVIGGLGGLGLAYVFPPPVRKIAKQAVRDAERRSLVMQGAGRGAAALTVFTATRCLWEDQLGFGSGAGIVGGMAAVGSVYAVEPTRVLVMQEMMKQQLKIRPPAVGVIGLAALSGGIAFGVGDLLLRTVGLQWW